MANIRGLGVSKKYANGSIHENGTGQFVILNRFEGEDGLPYLEFEWLTGEKAGQVDQNKEVNINASIHKFNTNRRAAGVLPITSGSNNNNELSIMEKLDLVLDEIYTNRRMVLEATDKYRDTIEETQRFNKEIIDNALEIAKAQRGQTAELISQINHLTDVMKNSGVSMERLSTSVHSLVTHSNMINAQQDMLSKMLEKIK